MAESNALYGALTEPSREGRKSVDDGRIGIDNSAAERALRAVALGRKNYLFCGSDGGGESAAAIYTLLGTARLNEVDPERWLREVLTCIADHPLRRIEDLLPWNLLSRSGSGDPECSNALARCALKK